MGKVKDGLWKNVISWLGGWQSRLGKQSSIWRHRHSSAVWRHRHSNAVVWESAVFWESAVV
jgi:hypothetical protein